MITSSKISKGEKREFLKWGVVLGTIISAGSSAVYINPQIFTEPITYIDFGSPIIPYLIMWAVAYTVSFFISALSLVFCRAIVNNGSES